MELLLFVTHNQDTGKEKKVRCKFVELAEIAHENFMNMQIGVIIHGERGDVILIRLLIASY